MRLICFVAGLTFLLAASAFAQSAADRPDELSIDRVINAGRPLRVALDERVTLKHVGQVVTGTVREPVYAYDRIVIAVGTKVRGHVTQIDGGSRWMLARAYLNGNFSPAKRAVLQFDTLVLEEGEVPIATVVTGGFPNVRRTIAGGSPSATGGRREQTTSRADENPTLAARARGEIRQRAADAVADAKQKVGDTVAAVRSLREPGQLRRLKDAAVQQLPYHPQYLAQSTVYDAQLTAPLSFGRSAPTAAAPAGTLPSPDSVLTARLTSTLDSSKTPRGTAFEAVLTEPVFSADRLVVLPEGTTLTGEVTFAKAARRFHRNGQLRFLFERVQIPNQPSAPLVGALHAVDTSSNDHVAVDDEGGATVENSKTRFIAPALSLLALHASMEGDGHRYADPDGDGSMRTAGSGVGGRGMGGFLGMGLVGVAVSQVTRPVGLALGVYGAARAIYSNILGKGREVTFQADTPIQVRLAPGPSVR